jgi:hypothetical protein
MWLHRLPELRLDLKYEFKNFLIVPLKSCDTSTQRLLEVNSVSPHARTGGKLFLPMATGAELEQPAFFRAFSPPYGYSNKTGPLP